MSDLIPGIRTASNGFTGAWYRAHRAIAFTPTKALQVNNAQLRAAAGGVVHVSVWRTSDQTKLGGVDITGTANTVVTAPLSLTLLAGTEYLLDGYGVGTGTTYYHQSADPGFDTSLATAGDTFYSNSATENSYPTGDLGAGTYYGYVGLDVVVSAPATNVSYFDGASWHSANRSAYDGSAWKQHSTVTF